MTLVIVLIYNYHLRGL